MGRVIRSIIKHNFRVLLVTILFLIVILHLLNTSFSQSPTEEVLQDSIYSPVDTNISETDTLPIPLDRVIPNNAFSVGEKLTFVVRYGFIKAGEATMGVEDIVDVNERKAYKIASTAKSAKAFDVVFKVRDRVETYIDTEGLFSWKFKKMLREGSYKFDLLVDYDQFYSKAIIQSIRYENEEPLRIKNKEEFEIDIPLYVLDILSSFYYVRTQNLRVGYPIYLTNHDNKKIYDLKVIVQKKEVKKVKAGKFRCIMVEPMLRGEAIFKQKGKLWVWLSDDQYKIPVLMKSAVFVGKITTELKKIEGMSLPLPSQIE